MSTTARIVVNSGPDRGKMFQLSEELVHIGTDAANQIVLADRNLADHQASIVKRNGRYAIFSPHEAAVEVDGNALPAERWVWLPSKARIRMGARTALDFTVRDENAAAASSAEQPENKQRTPEGGKDTQTNGDAGKSAARSSTATTRSRRRREKPRRTADKRANGTGRKVARFITDQGDSPLVTLGEDGHLPQLSLAEPGRTPQQADEPKPKSGGAGIYVAVAASLALSVGMLLVDYQPGAGSAADKAHARQAISRFYGESGKDLERYQRLLREARLARARGDYEAERRAYRRVLKLVHSEDKNPYTGLTGSPERDNELRRLIGILLRE